MVPIGDVQRGHGVERRNRSRLVGPVQPPDRVAHAVGTRQIEERILLAGTPCDRIDGDRRAVGEEHDAGLRAQHEHVASAVVFLVTTRPFVLLDDAPRVLLERVAPRETGLFVVAVLQPVAVQRGRVLQDERRIPP